MKREEIEREEMEWEDMAEKQSGIMLHWRRRRRRYFH
jgi:hypothetical protein